MEHHSQAVLEIARGRAQPVVYDILEGDKKRLIARALAEKDRDVAEKLECEFEEKNRKEEVLGFAKKIPVTSRLK
ncbi:hypothetical protein KIN20_027001 [Parelaphostrongylus tenuis]|uniref:Uncharacterized protein n=1 Tax=Parelaphostrongylus tenuis TaxID=148309 RepID=A0AAD5QYU2_PARTN|nr:hypothetical protein KIN20_027001 [Parelaphostrongylus tenuis]